MGEKERLINMFFSIGGSEQTQALQTCKFQCERFLLEEESVEIKYLINVINAVTIYFETGDKEKAKEWVDELWDQLYPKANLSFFEIRILTSILFTELNIEKVIEITEKFFYQLKIYEDHEDCIKVKIAIHLNLLDLLMKSRFFDSNYKSEYDNNILNSIQEIISLNLKSELNSAYYVGLADTYKGILLKDKDLIYTGLLLFKSSKKVNDKSIQDFVKVYTKKYIFHSILYEYIKHEVETLEIQDIIEEEYWRKLVTQHVQI